MKKRKRKNNIIFSVLIIALLAGVLWTASLAADYRSGSLKTDSVTITVPDGAGTADIARSLKSQGVISHSVFFRFMSRVKGFDGKYRTGEFEIRKGNGYLQLFAQLTTPSAYHNGWLTIPEGYTLKKIAAAVSSAGLASQQAFTEALNQDYDFDFLPAKKRNNYLEGYLFPDTYNFTKDMTPQDMIRAMLKRFDAVFTQQYRQRAQAMGLSMDEVVILASMIEAEAGSDADRAKVSSVFHNRLASSDKPYLESCATVQYILGKRKNVLSVSDTKINSPYNTYINKGLPIGPICSPGEASIKAALYPEQTDYYYFQSDANGKLYYAETFDAHERIRRQLQDQISP